METVPLDFPFSGIEFILLHNISIGDYKNGRQTGIISSSAPLSGRQGFLSGSHLAIDSARLEAFQEVGVGNNFEIFDEFLDFLFPSIELYTPPFWAGIFIDQEGPFSVEDGSDLIRFAEKFQSSLSSFWARWKGAGLRYTQNFDELTEISR